MGVGIGEAGGVAPSYALIADYFEPRRRARALAIFSLGVPIGLAARNADRRLHRPCDQLARGLLHAWASRGSSSRRSCSIVVRDPARHEPASAAAPIGQVFPMLARKPVFWLLAFAASSSSLCGYGLAVWTPSVLERSFGLGPDRPRPVPRLGDPASAAAPACLPAAGSPTGSGALDRGWYAQASGDRLADHSADLCCRAVGAEPVARLAAAADPQCAEHPVARSGHHRGPAPRAAARCERPPRQASC